MHNLADLGIIQKYYENSTTFNSTLDKYAWLKPLQTEISGEDLA